MGRVHLCAADLSLGSGSISTSLNEIMIVTTEEIVLAYDENN